MRSDQLRLDDVLAAAAAIESHLERGRLADGLVFDAVRVRLSPTTVIDELIAEIAEEQAIASNWLNQKASPFFPAHGLPAGQVIIERAGLTVSVGPPRFLLAMKLRAARLGRDNDDIAVLLRRCDARSVDEAIELLAECYDGEEPFKPMARLIVEAALDTYAVTTARPPFTLDAVAPR